MINSVCKLVLFIHINLINLKLSSYFFGKLLYVIFKIRVKMFLNFTKLKF